MRVSSAQMFQQGIAAILQQQSKLAHTEQQLATGRRILTPADDPVAAAQILDISENLALADRYQRNANIAGSQLALEESVLAQAGTLLERVRELLVQANNATQTPESRRSIAAEIEGRIDELLGFANTRDAGGEYLFAGFQSLTQPFARQDGAVVYRGDSGQRSLQVGGGVQVAVRDSGRDVFMSAPSGNGTFSVQPDGANAGTAVIASSSVDGTFLRDDYRLAFVQATPLDPVTYEVRDSGNNLIASGTYSPGDAIEFAGARLSFKGTPADGDAFDVRPASEQAIFSILQGAVDALQAAGTAPVEVAALNNAMAVALDELDQAQGALLEVRAQVGVRLQLVQSQLDINDSFNLQLQETLSGLQDLDFAEAVSRFNLELTALQAAQQAYVRMQGLSLFNFL